MAASCGDDHLNSRLEDDVPQGRRWLVWRMLKGFFTLPAKGLTF
jgi:hypothetical protein